MAAHARMEALAMLGGPPPRATPGHQSSVPSALRAAHGFTSSTGLGPKLPFSTGIGLKQIADVFTGCDAFNHINLASKKIYAFNKNSTMTWLIGEKAAVMERFKPRLCLWLDRYSQEGKGRRPERQKLLGLLKPTPG